MSSIYSKVVPSTIILDIGTEVMHFRPFGYFVFIPKGGAPWQSYQFHHNRCWLSGFHFPITGSLGWCIAFTYLLRGYCPYLYNIHNILYVPLTFGGTHTCAMLSFNTHDAIGVVTCFIHALPWIGLLDIWCKNVVLCEPCILVWWWKIMN